MELFRVTQKTFADLEGIGGLIAASRWNEKGYRVVYLAENRALAILEYLVNITGFDIIPRDVVLMTVSVPDDFKEIDPASLPPGWPKSSGLTRKLGTEFLREKTSLLLKVPSIHVPHEWNFLFNPAQADSQSCELKSIEDLEIDNRFFPIL
jgi:RES domain-containing protein